MVVKPLATLLAIKVLNFVPGLTANARAVGGVLIERFNRRTGRCDPGINGIATQLAISSRTVIRALNKLVEIGLVRRDRHGGYCNRNSYQPLWSRFAELEAAWRARHYRRPDAAATDVSPSNRQDGHLAGDNPVTQTYSNINLPQLTCSGGLPNKGSDRHYKLPQRKAITFTTPSSEAARSAAEQRWVSALDKRYRTSPLTYIDIVNNMSPELKEAATDTEVRQRGTGLAYVERVLKLRDGQSRN